MERKYGWYKMNLIYGTYNPSKLKSMNKMVAGLRLNITGLNKISPDLNEPVESGNDPLSNAIIKAEYYFERIQKPIFSCDSGLYFENVSTEDQPGVRIKRIHGKNLKDEEFISYYSKLAKKYGGKLTAYYKNSICLILDECTSYKFDGLEIQSEKFYLVEKPHKIYKKGFPLDSLSVHIESGQHYYDLGHSKNENWGIVEGFRNFFIDSLKLEVIV